MRALALAGLAVGAAGHGYVLDPPPRAASHVAGSIAGSAGTCATGICFWFSQGCTIGCAKCGGSDGDATCGAQQGKQTLPTSAKSYNYYALNYTKQPCKGCPVSPVGDYCGTNPWCAPGSAPIMDPCGIAGGDSVEGKPGNGGDPPAFHKQGEKGTDLPELKTKATWKAGGVANISWTVIANHGGGYQYRLCKKSAKQTEDCFQQTPLAFADNQYYIQYCTSSNQYPPYNPYPGTFKPCEGEATAFPATEVSTGTIPAGSTWRRNPIPACRAPNGGAFGESCGATDGRSPDDYQFPPAGPDKSRPGQLLGGFGAGGCYGQPYGMGCAGDPAKRDVGRNVPGGQEAVWSHLFHFNIVDTVRVPQLPAGDYVMSFRWDCEQTPQIWSTCSDVTIE